MAEKYRRGGFGYGEIKKAVADASELFFGDARKRRADLEKNLDYVEQVLRDGAAKARDKAGQVLLRAQRACGLR
jgi:tryptophanyl-tRNA synthetase